MVYLHAKFNPQQFISYFKRVSILGEMIIVYYNILYNNLFQLVNSHDIFKFYISILRVGVYVYLR